MRNKPATWQNPAPIDLVFNNLPSRTVPDQVLSMDDLVKRYVRGDPNVTKFTPSYSDEDIPDLRYTDEMERTEMARALKARNDSDLAVMKANESARRRQKSIDDAVKDIVPSVPSVPPVNE